MARRSEDIDKWVGRRIGELRRDAGLSQAALASSLDLSFQQIQKYEAGLNRVSAARLYQLSMLFDCPVADFFPAKADEPAPSLLTSYTDRDQLALMAAFPRIRNEGVRRSVLDIVEALALR